MLNYQYMQSKQASKIFEALSSDVRLDLFRLLVKNAPDGLVQGDIARQLDIPTTNLSFHLKAIVQSGLVDVEREGRFMRYKANIPLMLEVIAYLTSECCSGNPEQCQKFRDASAVLPGFLPKRG
jgi:DNA-binding transcriptional ArsR family regulator